MSTEHGAGDTGRGNALVIEALLRELSDLGVPEFCVCAGARNAPLLDVLAQQEQSAGIAIRSFYEERSAAFFALGRVMVTRKPVAVVTTSGTAVAELFPAVMEAYYEGLPLVLVTADRPSRYRGSGAPQAVEQSQIFGQYAPSWSEIEFVPGRGCCMDQLEVDWGPVHINVCLEEGLIEEKVRRVEVSPIRARDEAGESFVMPPDLLPGWGEFWESTRPGVVLASGMHPDEAKMAAGFLAELGWPVVGEATANLHDHGELKSLMVTGGEAALRALDGGRVLRVGGVPSWRWWRDLDAREDVPVLNMSTTPFRGLARTENVATGWLKELTRGSVQVAANRAQKSDDARARDAASRLGVLLESHPHSEPAWMRHLSRVIGEGATVFLGNSLPIREWNLAAEAPKRGTQFFANRGANGIDGLISTWLGVGAESAESWLIVGDLSALYDLSAPWILPQLRKAKRRIVVINNGGGKIFSRVAWLKSAREETRRMMDNPHEISFEPWAKMWGMGYRLVTEVGEVRGSDGGGDGGICEVWEVRPDGEQTEAFWREWQG